MDNTKIGNVISLPNEVLPGVEESIGSLENFCGYLSRVLEES